MTKEKQAINNILLNGINPTDISILKSNTCAAIEELVNIQFELDESIKKSQSDSSLSIYLPIWGMTQNTLNEIKSEIMSR